MSKRVASLKTTVMAVSAVISAGLVGAVAVGLSSAARGTGLPTDPTTVYSSLVSPMPGNIPSLGVESYYFDELGNEVNLASSGTLSNVVVTMSSFSCESGSFSDDTCVTTPGATFAVPITFNIYSTGTGNTPGALIASDTQTFNIPFRPTADNLTTPPGANCPGGEGEWYDSATGSCYNGFATNITFDASSFTPPDPTLPGTVVYGIAYNTTTNGYDPLGVSSPADGLNIGMSTDPTNVTVGSDADPGFLFMAQSAAFTSYSEITCATTLPAGVFQSYDVMTTGPSCGLGSSGNIPAVQVNTAAPVSTTTTSTTLTTTSTTLTATTTTLTATTTTAPVIPPSPTTSTTTSPTTTTPKPFPHSNVSFPNGAIVSFGSTPYVFAGGRAFEASATELAAVQKVDPAKVLSAPAGTTAPTSVVPRPGVLVFTGPVNGNRTIYVVGTDGQLHGFATPSQFVHDGYDPALVVTVPNLGSLTVGSNAGTTLTALATRADGAVVDSSGTFYTFAGGKGFGIPTQASLLQIRKTNPAEELHGSVGPAETGAAMASGVVLSVAGPVYVSYQGDVYPFKTMTQLANDGYGGTAAVPTPHAGGLTAVFPYSGS
jgi:hypothetical protein